MSNDKKEIMYYFLDIQNTNLPQDIFYAFLLPKKKWNENNFVSHMVSQRVSTKI